MRRIVLRVIGFCLIAAGLVGLVLCGVALGAVARAQRSVEGAVYHQLDLIESAVRATADGLDVADRSLEQTVETVASLKGTVEAIGTTVEESQPTLDAVADLLGEQLPRALETTQETLASAAVNAKALDDAMAILAEVPFLGVGAYDPQAQLHIGLQEVASSLDGVPDSLRGVQTSMGAARKSLSGVQDDIGLTADNIGQIGLSLEGARGTLDQFDGIVADLGTSVAALRSELPPAIRWVRIGVTFVLVWLGIAQLALITQGGELVVRSRRANAAQSAT